MKIKDEYNSLLENGELLDMFPELSGSWLKDKSNFTVLWEKNIEAIKKIDVNFDEYE
ncbi:MAG: hypothetical protein ACJAVA_000332 [Flavobacteriaceae bacterium]|jgi:hypothetical protein